VTDEVLVVSGVDDALLFGARMDKRLPIPEFMRQWTGGNHRKWRSPHTRVFDSIAKTTLPTVEGTLEQTDVSFNPPVRSDRSLWRNRLLLDRLLLRAERLGVMLQASGGKYLQMRSQALDEDAGSLRPCDGMAVKADFEHALKGAEAARTDAEGSRKSFPTSWPA